MALKNLLTRNHAFSMENIEIRSGLKLIEDEYEISHVLNPDSGTYRVSNKLGNKIMEFDNKLNLKSGNALHSHIQSKNMEITDRLELIEHDEILTSTTTTTPKFKLTEITIGNNKFGLINGKVFIQNGEVIEFNVSLKNVSNTITVNAVNLDYYFVSGTKTLTFEISASKINVFLDLLSSNVKYKLFYKTELIDL